MRILIYSYNYHPEPIGIAPLMTELAEGLVTKGHEVRVVTAMPNYPQRKIYPQYRGQLFCEEERNGVKIQRCYVAIHPNPGVVTRVLLDGSFSLLSFLQALKGWRPDVILSTSPSLPACIPVAVLKLIYGCPTVLSLQDILPEAAVRTGLISNQLAIRIFEVLEKFAYASATRVAVITDSFSKNLVSKGVPVSKIKRICNWVDTNFIRPLPKYDNQFRQKYGLQDKFIVLYSGNIARTQGVRTIIHAAEALQHFQNIEFVIVGEERQLGDLRNLRKELGVNNVTLLPFAPRAELPTMLAAADVSLIMQKASVVGFNMPSKTMVLLASGRPIVASVPDGGAAAQAVRDSGGGLVVEPEKPKALAKAIQDLYHDPERIEQLGKRGRGYAIANYSFEQSLEGYETLLDSVVDKMTATTSMSSTLRPKKITLKP
ncbi:colanic acid biosynthesis glycosyltransferase WcaI [Leptolyngbyaceae cyanobacterium CCMR0082]|uniref:Colanic acid biosynthesis glycosyltransferase WcaI n=2 Tax=Adonisia turfae TaxID=2950184 RepID=A0A6M0RZK2_9CYAN|nr:glycosyltransferase family 4 protein [Adonisia turfae]MDV3352218.1 glycosyltransferase family 4 protein [Leptothoe sp. LEGE 181152]NEZ57102.1 colanic acid biosynthesis glycosyltransferase WcaI [Adonisia turfae CCMR0081]NEZ61648.1 colanic acid biosynthesis glycosyltransferase WcaI [Adonisia turfae CCMR0082]